MSRGTVLLIQAPYAPDYGPMRKASGTYFPLGLGYISAFIRQKGYETFLVDPDVQDVSLDQIVDLVQRHNPVAIGVSFMTPQFFWVQEVAIKLKKNHPAIPIVLGGAHPSVMPKETLVEIPDADFVVHGEGEETMAELLDCLLLKDKDFGAIGGLAWRDNSQILVNPPRELINDLDTLPSPDRGLIDQSLYRQQSFLSYSSRAMTIHTSRGCPSSCVFCASGHRLKSRVRERSIDNVMREIDELRKKWNMDYLLIKDDTFTLRKPRVEAFCKELSKRHPGLKWHCMVRVNTVDELLLAIMKSAGLNDVFLGIESGNNDILHKARKGITVEQTRKVVEACDQLRIHTYGAFILGLPDETLDTMQQTIDFACSLPLTMAGFSILIPYPGTQVFDEHFHSAPEQKTDYSQFIASSGINYVRDYTGVSPETLSRLPKLVAQAQRRFYLRPRQVARMITSSGPSMWLGAARGAVALLQKEIYLRSKRHF